MKVYEIIYLFLPNPDKPEPKIFAIKALRAHSKITSHFKHRFIPPGCVAKTRNMPDITAFSRLASRAPQHLKIVN
jgi:hypothetical protein